MNVNRIFCIGRNYAEHIRELGNSPDDACLVFMKPASCVVPVGQPIVLPRGRGSVHHEAELVVMLGGGGNVTAITLGLDLTLRELQGELKKKGAPWELSKAFDHSAPLGEWAPYRGEDLQGLEFSCDVNGQRRQTGHTKDMLFPVARIIGILSQTWALQAGDIIYTGTPAGVGPLAPGDRIALSAPGLGRFEWSCR
jgi:2-keto-4-pentenoate hydratase/2-oxohepta-3-ene-1,7-dioic acid hydratase in catechol pathway